MPIAPAAPAPQAPRSTVPDQRDVTFSSSISSTTAQHATVAKMTGAVAERPIPGNLLTIDTVALMQRLETTTVVDTRPRSAYLDGHVHGAISMPLGALLIEDSSATALERLAVAARTALAARGVSSDDDIVLVDGGDGSAAVGLLVCELAGCTSIAVLTPGMHAWLASGGETRTTPTVLPPTGGGWDEPHPCHSVASFEDVEAAIEDGVVLLDVRSQLEHEGIVGPACCGARGHIPGSVQLEWTAMLDATGTMRSTDPILREAGRIDLSPAHDVIVYCHSGHRAAIAALALRSAGFEHVRVSLGSFHEWSSRELRVGPLDE